MINLPDPDHLYERKHPKDHVLNLIEEIIEQRLILQLKKIGVTRAEADWNNFPHPTNKTAIAILQDRINTEFEKQGREYCYKLEMHYTPEISRLSFILTLIKKGT